MKSNRSTHARAIARATFTLLTLGTLISATALADSKGTEVRLRTPLAGGAISGKAPSGSADFRMESDRNRSRLNVEVENVNLGDATMLSVMVTHMGATTSVGQIRLHGGFGELELNSQDGDTVPAIVKGDMITVSNAGTAILTGVF